MEDCPEFGIDLFMGLLCMVDISRSLLRSSAMAAATGLAMAVDVTARPVREGVMVIIVARCKLWLR